MRFTLLMAVSFFVVGCQFSPVKDMPSAQSGEIKPDNDVIEMYIYPSSESGGRQGYFLEFDVEPDSQETVRYRG